MEEIPLPVIGLCALDADGLRSQRDRYRLIGAHAQPLERSPRHLVLGVDPGFDDRLIENAVTVERGCCPFFSIDWQPEARKLAISVACAEHEPALSAIIAAFELLP